MKTEKKEMKAFSLFLPMNLWEKLKIMSAKQKTSMQQILTELIPLLSCTKDST